MPNLRLIEAEVLKLRRRPGMLTVAFGLTLGLLALAYLVTGIQRSGVFRDLAATGRSRSALFLARVGGAWTVVGTILAISLAFDAAAAFALADGTATPGFGDIAQAAAMVSASGAIGAALAVGLAALFGSRGPVIGILIAAHLVFEPQLQGAGFLGDARQALPISAINRIGDAGGGLDYKVALGTALAVVCAWIAAALAAGAWRTKTREI